MKIDIPGASILDDDLSQKKTRAQAAGEAMRRVEKSFPKLVHEPFDGVVAPPPSGLKAILDTFGDPNPTLRSFRRTYKVNKYWAANNGITLSASQISGYHRKIWMHKVVAPVFKEAMRRSVLALKEMGIKYEFRKIGCHNARHKRYDEELGWSTHTWAIAFDINPDTNEWAPVDAVPFVNYVGSTHTAGSWKRFSDIPEVVVEVFENLGFQWGGRWKGKKDTMHFQWCRGY